ncbi:MAG: hypothetical protein ABI823_21610, partial [Bryobacteraceae bacterium]
SNVAKPYSPPGEKSAKSIQKLEKLAGGAIPVSLRAFYDVVGEVNLLGTHPSIAPAESNVSSDPLVVYGVEDAVECLDGGYGDDDEQMIVIAPDALHKSNTSGGDPYAIRVPDSAADAIVDSEPHNVTFVEYLRLAFAWGGFPGWEDSDAIQPPELEELRRGLLPI